MREIGKQSTRPEGKERERGDIQREGHIRHIRIRREGEKEEGEGGKGGRNMLSIPSTQIGMTNYLCDK